MSINLSEYFENAPSPDVINYVASHPRLRVSDFTTTPETPPNTEQPLGIKELIAECQARKPLNADAPRRFHPQFYAEVSRIRAARLALGTPL